MAKKPETKEPEVETEATQPVEPSAPVAQVAKESKRVDFNTLQAEVNELRARIEKLEQ